MPTLKNIRHERFAQNVVSGLSLSAAYIAAGYKEPGASANGTRLMATEAVSLRVAELRHEIERNFIQLQITDRNERLKAAQERYDAMREVIQARKTCDCSRALKTGLVVRQERVIGSGKNAKLVEEYQVDTALLAAMADLEKQVAIETGEWSQKREVSLNADIQAKAITLAKVMSIEELEVLQKKLIAAAEDQQRKQLAEAKIDQDPGKYKQ
jgi:phage terminase small subunit